MRRRLAAIAPLALVAYVPLLLTAPGRVAADTKTYLYLDPARLLSRAWSMWDPNIGLGTVTHQTIGYLWPMGPWFWFWETVGAPDWVAQRLWLGTVMVAAGAGVLYLLRALGIRHLPAIVAAALVYELSPYLLHYAARISVILLPWAALPWLLALTHRSLHAPRSWRYPAAFALIVATAGGVNATALVLAGLAPLVWVLWSLRTLPCRDVAGAVLRIGVLTVPCSLWWMSGLWVQGGWGIDILRYTETVETVARTSLSSEVLRGLGYWFFYGGDKLGSWIEPGRSYTQVLPLLAVGFLVPLLAFAASSVLRWTHRTPFVLFVLLGTAVAVGAYPYDDPSPIGGAFKAFATSSTVGLALRSTPRAVPLVVLGIAVLLGAAVAARRATAIAIAVGVVAVLGIPPLWTGEVIGENLQRDEDVPRYWLDAAAALDAGDHGTRVLELPGTDFASYRWGSTVDPITPGLIDRPYVARELIPYGTPASADLLIAFDRRLQEMVYDPASLAPVARLLGVGHVVVRSDLQYERYRTPRPRTLWASLQERTSGIGAPVAYGDPVPNRAIERLPLRDEVYLSTEQGATDPPPVAVFPVDEPLPIVRARSATAPVLLAGDGEGVVEAAAAGLLGGDGVVLYSAALTDAERAAAIDDGALLVLTDTNRQRGRRWATMRDNAGYTEARDETPVRDDPSDNRLPLWAGAADDAYTYAEQRGVDSVRASAYGNPVSFTPEDRPANALDGNIDTAWQVGALDEVGGERWVLDTSSPKAASAIGVVQPLGLANRWITRLEVVVNGSVVTTTELGDASRTPGGQVIELGGSYEIDTLELVVRGDNIGRLPRYDGFSGVGFAEVRIGDDPLRVDETTVLPGDLLAEGAAGKPLAIVLARMRSNPIEPTSGDEELAMSRTFTLPDDRLFDLTGQVRLSAALRDERIDEVLGGIIPVRTSSRLRGDLMARGASAVDGDPTTAWTTGFGEQRGQWLELETEEPVTVDSLDLSFVDDGDHSVPTRLRVRAGGDSIEVDVPAGGGPVALPRSVSGSPLRIEVVDVRDVQTTDWYSERPITMPIGVTELGLGLTVVAPAGRIDDTCRAGLLALDGAPVSVRLLGTVADALARRPIGIEPCGEIMLPAGRHELRATPGATTGFDLDRLVLTDGVEPSPGALPTAAAAATVDVVSAGRSTVTVDVSGDEPFWLVLGQSHSTGWSASGGLGEPTLVDGYANGWLVDPAQHDRITLTFTPQRTVTIALVASAAAAVLCIAVLLFSAHPGRQRRPGCAENEGLAWVWPWMPTGSRPGAGVVVAAGIGAGVLGGLLVHPLTGLGVGVATIAGVLAGRGPGVLAVGSIAGLGLAASFTIAKQWRNDYPPDFGWPGFFGPAHHLAWVGLLLLVASVLTGALRRRAARRGPRSA